MFPNVLFAAVMYPPDMFWPGGSSGPARTLVYHLTATVAIDANHLDLTNAKVTPL